MSDPLQTTDETAVKSLNMQRPSDRIKLRQAVSDGWPINPDDMARFYGMLKWAAQRAMEHGDVREVNSCLRTMVTIVGQVQSDQQLAEKYARIDSGKPTEGINHSGEVAYREALDRVSADPEAIALITRLQLGDAALGLPRVSPDVSRSNGTAPHAGG